MGVVLELQRAQWEYIIWINNCGLWRTHPALLDMIGKMMWWCLRHSRRVLELFPLNLNREEKKWKKLEGLLIIFNFTAWVGAFNRKFYPMPYAKNTFVYKCIYEIWLDPKSIRYNFKFQFANKYWQTQLEEGFSSSFRCGNLHQNINLELSVFSWKVCTCAVSVNLFIFSAYITIYILIC